MAHYTISNQTVFTFHFVPLKIKKCLSFQKFTFLIYMTVGSWQIQSGPRRPKVNCPPLFAPSLTIVESRTPRCDCLLRPTCDESTSMSREEVLLTPDESNSDVPENLHEVFTTKSISEQHGEHQRRRRKSSSGVDSYVCSK